MNPFPRVVVTGLGVVSPLGVGVGCAWEGLLGGRSGVVPWLEEDSQELPCRIVSRVPEGKDLGHFDWTLFSPYERRQMSRGISFALVAAQEAIDDAKLTLDTEEEREKTGVAIGMGISDLEDIKNTGNLLDAGKYSKVSPYFVPRILTNMAAGHIGIKYKLKGPNHSVATACTTGIHSIGDAYNFIRLGYADTMICGGSESCINNISLGGFARCRALATHFNDNPTQASRPFDSEREGFVMGEGAGIVVLESLSAAKMRKVPKVYAEILGYGLSSDGHHLTSPDPEGRGAQLCMQRALDDAKRFGINSGDVRYVNAHATSTPLGDHAESQAIFKTLVEPNSEKAKENKLWPAVSSNKGAIGHLLGGAGAVETIFTVLSCYSGMIPPTLNLTNSDIPFGLNYVPQLQNWPSLPHSAHYGTQRVALKNSFGFGGTNASLCIADFNN